MTDSAAGTRAISSVPDGMGFGTSPTGTQHVAAAVAPEHGGEVQADGPSFGPRGHRRGPLMRDVHVCLREDLLGA
jgi:hypothetical protein